MTMKLVDKLTTLEHVRHQLIMVLGLNPRTDLEDLLSPDFAQAIHSMNDELERARVGLIEGLGLGKDADWYLIRKTVQESVHDLGGLNPAFLDLVEGIPLSPRIIWRGSKVAE